MIFLPLDQFDIRIFSNLNLGVITFFFTNYFIAISCVFFLIFLLFLFGLQRVKFLKSKWHLGLFYVHYFIYDLIKQEIGLQVLNYFVLLFTGFLFILNSNILGLIPFNFALTSHILTTFNISLSFFCGIIIIGFKIQGLSFVTLFWPQGIPTPMKPFLCIIELITYFSRVFSLSIRLFANIMSGHALLYILSGFGVLLYLKNKIFLFRFLALVPMLIVLIICVLELGIAFLQAYVYLVLICIYFRDAFATNH